MSVGEQMTRDVKTTSADTSLKGVAQLLWNHEIGGMPVLDDAGRLIGVISKTDIVLRQEQGRHSFTSLNKNKSRPKPHTAGEAMHSPAITIDPDASLTTAADKMRHYGLNRLPVVQDGKLVGIITRHDLVGAYARDDNDLELEIREHALEGLKWPEALELSVHNGEVALRGQVDSIRDAERLPNEVAHVLGVTSVNAELTAWDPHNERQLAITTHI
jgi:CBS domain-containing protein